MLIKVCNRSSAMGLTYQKTRTLDLFRTICKVIYLSCATNFWFEDLKYPKIVMKTYDIVSKILEVVVFVFIISEFGSFYTQQHLTEKQANDVFLFAFSHAVIYLVYASALHYKNELRELVYILGVKLKEVSNDETIERMMIKSAGRYLSAFVLICSSTLFSYGVDSGLASLTTDSPFVTVIPMWPDVEDRRAIAGVTRVLHYIIWWIFVIRVISVYLIILTVTICLAYQFTTLCKYFENLNSIFEGSGSQADKEKRYEDAFKVGIKMHCTTLWCARQTQVTGGVAFSGQVVINLSVLVLLMMQMMYTERSLMAVLPILFMAASVLVGSGVFLWNAGDVTIEASRLPAAMFYSGWYNCQRETSVRVRKMVALSIMQAQARSNRYSTCTVDIGNVHNEGAANWCRGSLVLYYAGDAQRVAIKGFGFIELSYESFVKIAKSSYSLFSVIY